MTATYWLRMSAELWTQRDTLRLPDGITLPGWTLPAENPGVVLVRVRDEHADTGLEGTEVEWTVRVVHPDDFLSADEPRVEITDRRVTGVRGV